MKHHPSKCVFLALHFTLFFFGWKNIQFLKENQKLSLAEYSTYNV
jgi:hypothetical protein